MNATKDKPTQTMSEFFGRQDVRELMEIQKQFPPSSKNHQAATQAIKELAVEIGAGKYFE